MSNKTDIAALSKQLMALQPSERYQVIRFGDQRAKALLIREGLKKGAWTQKQVAEWLETEESQISRLLQNYAPEGAV